MVVVGLLGSKMAEKTKYRVEFYSNGNLLRTEYASAYSEKQAKVLAYRRSVKEGWDYLFLSDSVLVRVVVDAEGVDRLRKMREMKQQRWCPECGEEVENDYCQHCGRQRFSGWYGRHVEKTSAANARRKAS